MAATKKKAEKKARKAGAVAMAAKNSPYVQRVIDDEDLRKNVVNAYDSVRSAYERLSSTKASPATQIFDDKKLQKQLRSAASSINEVQGSLRESPKRRFGIGKLLLLTIIGAVAAVAVSEDLRKKVLDAVFGAEEEFEYTSATTAPNSAEASAAASSN